MPGLRLGRMTPGAMGIAALEVNYSSCSGTIIGRKLGYIKQPDCTGTFWIVPIRNFYSHNGYIVLFKGNRVAMYNKNIELAR